MAKRTFSDKMTIGAGAEQIDLYYFGRGHTNGDAWVVWPSLRVMHAGDIFSGKVAPILDANNGGSGLEIGDSLTKGADTVKNIDTIITGHSGQMTVADLALEYRAVQQGLRRLRPRRRSGGEECRCHRGRVQGAGEVCGLHRGRGAREEQRAGRGERVEEVDDHGFSGEAGRGA